MSQKQQALMGLDQDSMRGSLREGLKAGAEGVFSRGGVGVGVVEGFWGIMGPKFKM